MSRYRQRYELADPDSLVSRLYLATIEDILKRVQSGKACVRTLAIARTFLASEGVELNPPTPAQRKQCEAIRKAYLEQLQNGLKRDTVSASFMKEVLAFLNTSGLIGGLGATVHAQGAIQGALDAVNLPFPVH